MDGALTVVGYTDYEANLIRGFWRDGVENDLIEGHIGSCYMELGPVAMRHLRFLLPTKPPNRSWKFGIFHDGSFLYLCVIVRNFTRIMDNYNSIFFRCFHDMKLDSLCVKKLSYHEDTATAIFELFTDSAMGYSEDIVENEIKSGTWDLAESFFPALLGFCTVFDPLRNVLPNLLDSLYFSGGVMKFFVCSEVEKVLYNNPRSNENLREIRSWLLAIAGVSSLEDVGKIDLPTVMPSTPFECPLKIRNMYLHLGNWNSSYGISGDEQKMLLRRIFFDLPLLHPWNEQYSFVHFLYGYFICYNPDSRRKFMSRFPQHFNWIDEIARVIDALNNWMLKRQIEYAQSGFRDLRYKEYDMFKPLEFFVNLLKHIHQDLLYLRGEEEKTRLHSIQFGTVGVPAYFPVPFKLRLPRVYPRASSYSVGSLETLPVAFVPPDPEIFTLRDLVRLIEQRLDIQGLLHQALCDFLCHYREYLVDMEELVVVWDILALHCYRFS